MQSVLSIVDSYERLSNSRRTPVLVSIERVIGVTETLRTNCRELCNECKISACIEPENCSVENIVSMTFLTESVYIFDEEWSVVADAIESVSYVIDSVSVSLCSHHGDAREACGSCPMYKHVGDYCNNSRILENLIREIFLKQEEGAIKKNANNK